MPSSNHAVIDATAVAVRSAPPGMAVSAVSRAPPVATYRIEPEPKGAFSFSLRSSQSDPLLTSNPTLSLPAVEAAITWVRRAVGDDWRYRIMRTRSGKLYFVLAAPRMRLTCRSPEYASGEMMELAIRRLKDVAPAASIEQAH